MCELYQITYNCIVVDHVKYVTEVCDQPECPAKKNKELAHHYDMGETCMVESHRRVDPHLPKPKKLGHGTSPPMDTAQQSSLIARSNSVFHKRRKSHARHRRIRRRQTPASEDCQVVIFTMPPTPSSVLVAASETASHQHTRDDFQVTAGLCSLMQQHPVMEEPMS